MVEAPWTHTHHPSQKGCKRWRRYLVGGKRGDGGDQHVGGAGRVQFGSPACVVAAAQRQLTGG